MKKKLKTRIWALSAFIAGVLKMIDPHTLDFLSILGSLVIGGALIVLFGSWI